MLKLLYSLSREEDRYSTPGSQVIIRLFSSTDFTFSISSDAPAGTSSFYELYSEFKPRLNLHDALVSGLYYSAMLVS